MTAHLASTQQHCAAADLQRRRRLSAPLSLLDGRGVKAIGGSGRTVPQGCARSPINETKLAVLSVLDAFGRPVTAQELYQVCGEAAKSPAIIDYHLSTLVQMRVVELVIGPELRFRRLDRDYN